MSLPPIPDRTTLKEMIASRVFDFEPEYHGDSVWLDEDDAHQIADSIIPLMDKYRADTTPDRVTVLGEALLYLHKIVQGDHKALLHAGLWLERLGVDGSNEDGVTVNGLPLTIPFDDPVEGRAVDHLKAVLPYAENEASQLEDVARKTNPDIQDLADEAAKDVAKAQEFLASIGESNDPGCDRCGTHDRVEGSVYCAGCIEESSNPDTPTTAAIKSQLSRCFCEESSCDKCTPLIDALEKEGHTYP